MKCGHDVIIDAFERSTCIIMVIITLTAQMNKAMSSLTLLLYYNILISYQCIRGLI